MSPYNVGILCDVWDLGVEKLRRTKEGSGCRMEIISPVMVHLICGRSPEIYSCFIEPNSSFGINALILFFAVVWLIFMVSISCRLR